MISIKRKTGINTREENLEQAAMAVKAPTARPRSDPGRFWCSLYARTAARKKKVTGQTGKGQKGGFESPKAKDREKDDGSPVADRPKEEEADPEAEDRTDPTAQKGHEWKRSSVGDEEKIMGPQLIALIPGPDPGIQSEEPQGQCL